MPYIKGKVGVVVAGTDQMVWEELRAKTITTSHMLPGRLVKYDTDTSHFQLTASGDAGMLGFIGLDPRKSASVDYAAEEWARIGHGPGAVVVLYYDTGLSVTKGDALYAGNNGRVYKAAGTDPTKVIGYAEENHAGTAGPILVRLEK